MAQLPEVPPDGGWGWLIVLGSSIINFSTRSIEPSFGLLFGSLLSTLNVGTTGAGIIVSALDATINFSGVFVGPFVKKLSFRKVAILGAVLSSIAMITTSFANSLTQILITFSFIGGLGFGFATASTYVALNAYFNKKKGQAVGLAMTGSAVGFMAIPQIVSFLMITYEFRGTLLIMGALSLHALVGACLFQPVKRHMKPSEEKFDENSEMNVHSVTLLEKEPIKESEESGLLNVTLPQPKIISFRNERLSLNHRRSLTGRKELLRKMSVISNVSNLDFAASMIHIDVDSRSAASTEKDSREESLWRKVYELMDFELLNDPVYLNILYGISITYVAELNFKMVMPFFFANLGYTRQQTALALSSMAIADIVARITVAPILDRISLSNRTVTMFGMTAVALLRSIMAEQTETMPLMVCFIAHGFFRGMILINFPLVIAEYANRDNFPSVLGLSMVSKGIFIVFLGPVVGYIRDKTGSYPLCIHTQSIMIVSCILTWSTEYILTYVKQKKNKQSCNV